LKILVLLSFFFIHLAIADEEKHPLEKYTVLSDSLPTEFVLMINHLKKSSLTQDDLQRIIAASKLINSELANTPKPNIMFLFKSEIYKGILNNQYMKQKSLLQASTGLLESVKHKLNKHKIVYTDFSKWMINAIIKDFDPYLEKNFINQYQNIKRTNSTGLMKAKRLTKIMKYLSPWFNAIDKNTPEEFNKLNTQVIIDTLERISKKTYYFKTFTGPLQPNEAQALLVIPEIKTKKETQEVPDEKSLKDLSSERKEEAKKAVENLGEEDLSGASEVIDEIDPEESDTEEESE
jgi:hypothetical protein